MGFWCELQTPRWEKRVGKYTVKKLGLENKRALRRECPDRLLLGDAASDPRFSDLRKCYQKVRQQVVDGLNCMHESGQLMHCGSSCSGIIGILRMMVGSCGCCVEAAQAMSTTTSRAAIFCLKALTKTVAQLDLFSLTLAAPTRSEIPWDTWQLQPVPIDVTACSLWGAYNICNVLLKSNFLLINVLLMNVLYQFRVAAFQKGDLET